MEDEWDQMEFEIRPYRDSDTFVLKNVDDIQALLADTQVSSLMHWLECL